MTALDPHQAAAVRHRDGDLAVVAGAGSGKTRVLTERIVSRVVDDHVPLESIVAITFTEKAAAEMKERLAQALSARGVPHAAEEVERAAISTVHAFCARLLREHAVEAGVDPSFAVLDETESDTCVRAALAALAAELARDDAGVLARVARTLGGDADERLLDLYDAARASGRPFAEFLRTPDGTPGLAAARASLAAAVQRLAESLPGASEASASRGRAALARVETLPSSDDDAADLAAATLAAATQTSLQHVRAPEVKSALSDLRDALNALHAAAAEMWLAPQRDVLAGLLVRLAALHDAEKGDGARLDFADLELRAAGLLEGDAALRAEIAGRRSDLLVDEYQDTNPLQARLVDLLRSPGGLFVVGDPKQSIYGFRGADVDVFLARADDGDAARVTLARSYRARPGILAFTNAVFADGVSPGAPALGVRPVPFEPLEPTREAHPAGAPCVEIARLDGDTSTVARTAEARWIADRIVALASGDDALLVPAGDAAEPERLRRAVPGDVAVLLRTTTHVKLLERALTERDVPYTVVKGRGFYEAREVVDLANLLACVDCAADDLCLAAVLRSPLCGLDDESLYRLAAARGGSSREPARTLLEAAESAVSERSRLLCDAGRERLRAFLGVFHGLRSMRGRAPLGELVESAIRGTQQDVLVLARPAGRQRLANLRKIEDFARAEDDSGATELADFVRRLRSMRQREIRETEAPIAGDGAVRILTVHQAKGLEFPIVFVPDAARERHASPSGIVCHARDGVGLLPDLPWGTPKAEAQPAAYARIRAANDAREDAESMRLLYVALTRASEHLVITAPVASGRNTARPWWDRLTAIAPALAGGAIETRDVTVETRENPAGAARVLVHAAQAPAESSGRALRSRMGVVARALVEGRAPGGDPGGAARAAADTLLGEAARRPPEASGALFETTVSALMTFARCPEEFRRRHLLGIPESLELSFALPEDGDAGGERAFRPGDDDEIGAGLGARALGRAVHLALERLVPGWTRDVERVAFDAVASETRGASPAPDDVARVVRWTQAFQTSDLGRMVAALPRDRVRREQSVLLRAGPTIVRGQMDLIVHDGTGWVIVDYKAGRVSADSVRAYTVQMRLYALALTRIGGRPAQRATLFALEDGVAHDVDVSPPLLDELERGLLARFLADTRAGRYEPPPDAPCRTCAYLGGCPRSTV